METIDIIIEDASQGLLEAYADLSIAFSSTSYYRMDIQGSGLEGIRFVEVPMAKMTKDFDTKNDNPSHLIEKFGVSHWKVISAFDGSQRVGGCILAYDTQGIHMLEGKKDLGLLWDIRVAPDYRGQGIGRQLFEACKALAQDLSCRRLKIESQNNNPKACKFYADQGAHLSSINKHIYKDYPDEIQMIWSLDLA